MKGQKDHQLLIEAELVDADEKAEYPGIVKSNFISAT